MFFSAYLQSIIANYEKQRDHYTLTDLQVEYWEEKGRSLDGSERQSEKQVERLEVLAGLRKYVQKGQVLLVGKPGSGKSTALGRLRWELAQAALTDARQPVPVLVALRSDRSIVEMIEMELLKGDPDLELEEKEIRRLLRKQQFFLLLDGLNEIPSQPREHEMRQFREDYPRAPMIFTSRELGTGLGIEQKLAMCRLTERQMRSFVENYLPDYAEMLLRQLKDRLRELAETPLLLKLLCDVFDPVMQQIPQSKGELFRAVDAKFNIWKQREGVKTAEKFWQWNGEILRYLARGKRSCNSPQSDNRKAYIASISASKLLFSKRFVFDSRLELPERQNQGLKAGGQSNHRTIVLLCGLLQLRFPRANY